MSQVQCPTRGSSSRVQEERLAMLVLVKDAVEIAVREEQAPS